MKTPKSSGWLIKVSRVLIFTMLISMFMPQGWYRPLGSEAAITNLQAWSNVYFGIAFPGTYTYTVPAGVARMLVVAVSSHPAAAATQTCTVTYGDQSLTKAITNETTSSLAHTWLFYLQETSIAAASNTNLTIAITGGTTRINQVHAAVYGGVDQSGAPVSGTSNYNAANTTATFGPMTALTIGAGELGIEAAGVTRIANLTGRTISTPAAGWTIGTTISSYNFDVTAFAALTNSTAGSTTSNHTLNGSANFHSGSAMSIKQQVDLTVGNGTDPSSGNAPQGATGIAMDAFTLGMRIGTATVNTLTLNGSLQFTSSNVAAVKVYRDTGTIGTLDGDVQVATTTTWAGSVATLTFTSAENVSAIAGNYLVVIDVAAAAVIGNMLSGRITAATGTDLGVIVYNDTSSAGLTVSRGSLGVGDGFNPANASMPQASLKNAMNAYTLDMGSGSGTVTTLTLTGSAQFVAANVASIKIYRDNGAIGVLDNADVVVPINAPTWGGSVATLTFTTGEPVTTAVGRYLVVIDAADLAVVGNTLSGTITDVTGTTLGTPAYSDSGSGTLTLAAGGALTIGNGTNPVASNAPLISTDNALDAFTTVLSAGKGQITVLTLTGSANFTTTNIANIKIFADKAPLGTLNGADMLVPTTYTHAAAVATITFVNPEAVTTIAKNYLVVVDVKPGATVAQTFSASITTPATGTGYTSTTYSDISGTPLMTITKALFANATCTGCHGYSSGAVTGVFYDGTSRNTPNGAFVGSHATHVGEYGEACSVCHVIPAGETSASFNHRTGNIQIATNINGDTGGAYGKGLIWSQTNSPTAMQACTNVYCHSQGVSKAQDITRSMSAPLTTLNWGAAAACNSCHGNPPNYANGATTWGGTAKANSHGVHTTRCETCHSGTTSTGDSITDATLHANKAYNIAQGNGEVIGSYTYAEGGGACANISCHGGTAINDAAWGTSLNCTTCHNKVVNAPRASTVSGGTVATRSNAVAEFGLAWGHKSGANGTKTARAAVTAADCIVCHLEGNYTTQRISAYHGDGYINLRDPDAVTGETAITNISSATFSFVQFSTSYAAEARTSTGHTSNNVDNVLTQKFCLACHDSNGATNPTARTPGGDDVFMPWGGVNLGANYTVVNGAAVTGGLVDVKTQLTATYSSAHPVLGPRNKDFPTAAKLNDPYKPTGTRGTSGTLSQGVVINCFDCHNTATPLTTRTIVAHGNAVTIPGVLTITGNAPAAGSNQVTFCQECHIGYTESTAAHHNPGSALSNHTNSGMTDYLRYACNVCHSSGYNTAVVRPVRAMDVHGNNVLPAGGLTKTLRWLGSSVGTPAQVNAKPYAFIRNTEILTDHSPLTIGGTTYSPNCNMSSNTPGCYQSFARTYTVGGTY